MMAVQTTSGANFTRNDGTPLVPQPTTTKANSDLYYDPRHLNGRIKVQ